MSVVGVSVAAQQLRCLDSDLESRVLLRIEEEGVSSVVRRSSSLSYHRWGRQESGTKVIQL